MKTLKGQYLLLIILLIAFTLFLFLAFYELSFFNKDNMNPGIFGDFMGGVVGTILTAIASIFVYNTYETQRQQLEQQKKQINQDLIDNLYDRISREVNALEITFDQKKADPNLESKQISYRGIYVLYNFKDLYQHDNTVMNQLNLILISFEHLFKLTKSATYKWDMQKQMNMDRNYLLYYTLIIWPLHQFYIHKWDDFINKWKPPHPDSLGTRNRFEKLLKKTYQYLLERELVGMTDDETYKKIINSA